MLLHVFFNEAHHSQDAERLKQEASSALGKAIKCFTHTESLEFTHFVPRGCVSARISCCWQEQCVNRLTL